MDYKSCAANIFIGAGGYKNIASVSCCTLRIRVRIICKELVSRDILAENDLVEGLTERGDELQLILDPKDVCEVYDELCSICEFCKNAEIYSDISGVPTEQTCPAKIPANNNRKKKYTAEYFINAARRAMNGMKLPHERESQIIEFILMIAGSAAGFANEKCLDSEFVFAPGFVKAVMKAEKKFGQLKIDENVFVSTDGNAYIHIQYQKSRSMETYNLLVTNIKEKNKISYAGEIGTYAV